MSSEEDDRVKAIIARKQAADEAKRKAAAAAEQNEQKKHDVLRQRAAVLEKWSKKCVPLIEALIGDLNSTFGPSGLIFKSAEIKGSAAITKLNVIVYRDGQPASHSALLFNLTGVGPIQIVSPDLPNVSFDVDSPNPDVIKKALMDYLDKIVQ